MGVTSRKYASVIFVCSIAFLMIAPLQVIDVYAAVPAHVGTVSIGGYSDISVQLNWTPPASASGITDYYIQSSTDNSTWSLVTDPTSNDPTADIPNLTANTTYYFRVAAVSPDGAGEYSASVSQKTFGVAGEQTFGSTQSFNAGQEFGNGSTFAANQSFTGGVMEFGSGQTFAAGTEFANDQSFTGGTQTFAAGQTFGTGTAFAANQSFSAGAQTFGDNGVFGHGTEFAAGQGFTGAQTFGDSAEFGHGTTFGAAMVFGDGADFSAGTHTFSAAQDFKDGAKFGASQTFGAGEAHDFSTTGMTFGAGTDFGAARVFGAAMSFGGNQNWDGHVHTFGEDPAWDGLVDFAANQAFPKGASFAAGQTFEAGEDHAFGEFMDFASAPVFAKERTFGLGTYFSGLPSPDMGDFANTFADGGHMPAGQEFAVAQTFGEDMHFGDNTDFTAFLQTFAEGAHFGDGTTFKVGQELPADVVPPFGLMLSAHTCTTAACTDAPASAFLAPGEFLTPGVDPDPISSSITKDSKAIEMDGLGFAMTFNGTVGTAGTVTTDPIDPATLTSSTASATTGARTLSAPTGEFDTIGTSLNVSMGTAAATGTMDITLEYDESNIPSGQSETDIEFLHHVNGAWKAEDTCTQDISLNTITCTVSSLSPVGLGSPSASSTSSSSSTCTQCKVLRTHGGFTIDDQIYTLVKKYTEINTNEVKTGEPVTITLSVANASGSPRVTSAIVYMDVYGSPNNYKQSSSISYSPSERDKININDIGDLWTSVDVDSEIISHPIHQTAHRMNYNFTMIFDKPMDTSHIVLETSNHYGISEVLYVTGALKVVENDASTYTDDVELQEKSEPEVILQSAPVPEAVIEPELVIDTEPAFMSNTITSLVIDLEPIPSVLAEPTVDTEPLIDPEPKQLDFFAWLNSLFS